jgi:hypothetical protein
MPFKSWVLSPTVWTTQGNWVILECWTLCLLNVGGFPHGRSPWSHILVDAKGLLLWQEKVCCLHYRCNFSQTFLIRVWLNLQWGWGGANVFLNEEGAKGGGEERGGGAKEKEVGLSSLHSLCSARGRGVCTRSGLPWCLLVLSPGGQRSF